MARLAGKSDCWVRQHLSLLKLHQFVRDMMIPKPEEPETPRLTFQLAQLLVPLDHTEQLRLANRLMSEDMSLPKARRYVLAQRHEAGDKSAYMRDKGPRATLATVETIVADFADRIGLYIDMPPAVLNLLIDALGPRDLLLLVEQMNEVAGHLSGLAEAIERRRLATRRAS